jgi:L-ascorbate metabolism protein UlaG (beta-lactamase superfamily)
VPVIRQLRDLDAILIPHAHHDHLDLPSLGALGHDGAVLVRSGEEHGPKGSEVRAGEHD